ncbi:hypothetical protein TELCIR_24273 [Teladorsagia circumcincta]|uniref:Uncharacterized protein n=1 Tax=Teladorsagia circumcincta TaxID=45464 RepID=A0A2G9T8Y4_TELCI|nr:hypothetical protein TELCIR_24273 [Teladorsagia circumcincta]
MYIKVNLTNAKEEMKATFTKENRALNYTPYEYGSQMHHSNIQLRYERYCCNNFTCAVEIHAHYGLTNALILRYFNDQSALQLQRSTFATRGVDRLKNYELQD